MSTSRYPSYGSQPGSLISEVTQHFTPEVVRSARSMMGESEPVNDGVGANRVSTQGFGQERPIASNDTEPGRAQNRRTELTVTEK